MEWKKFRSENYRHYQDLYQTNSLLSKVLDQRQMNQEQIKQLGKMVFHDYELFAESQEVIERILEAIEQDESICIYGDYDCDGILATTILVKAFKMLGKDVGYHIPNRFVDGYGLNEARVQQMHEKGYTLIITVDNGIKAMEAIDLANELGIDVIVTDHHAFSDDLPNAYAFLHTKLSPAYPFKEISGGVVAYKLAYRLLGKHDRYLYCLAAITTISDMMPLVDENKAMVKKALMLMKECHFPAIDLLLGDNPVYSSTSIGFNLAPKVNSFGRLPEEVNPANCVKYFMMGEHPNPSEMSFLQAFASKAKAINSKRQTMTNQLYGMLKEEMKPEDDFIFLYEQPVHEGLIGLLAGKFTKEYNKVSFLMNYDETNNVYKGSARSLGGFKLNEFLETASDDLLFYGGHALAAGFTVKFDCIPSFYDKIKNAVEQTDFQEENKECIVLDEEDITLKNVASLRLLEPFGTCNEEPIFCIEDVLVARKNVLSGGKHLKISCIKEHVSFDAICFNCGDLIEQVNEGEKLSVIGQIAINEYQNRQYIQIILKDIL